MELKVKQTGKDPLPVEVFSCDDEGRFWVETPRRVSWFFYEEFIFESEEQRINFLLEFLP